MKKLFIRLFAPFSKYFSNLYAKAKLFLIAEIPVAIKAVELLQTFCKNPVTETLVALTPTAADDMLLRQAKEVLPKLLVGLGIARGTTLASSAVEIYNAALAELKLIDAKLLRGRWLMIANELSIALSDGKLTWNEIVHLVQYAFDKKLQPVVSLDTDVAMAA